MALYLAQFNEIWTLVLDRGGWTLVALIALSVLTVAAALRGCLQMIALKPFSSDTGAAQSLLEKIRAQQAQGIAASHIEEQATLQAKGFLRRAQSGSRLLEWIVTAAPLLGLFGTVLGMIDAFQAMQAAGQSVNPSDLAGGIWVALITTAAGMLVALLALALHSALDTLVDQLRYRLECVATEALATPLDSMTRPSTDSAKPKAELS